jgi:hypothetical protein
VQTESATPTPGSSAKITELLSSFPACHANIRYRLETCVQRVWAFVRMKLRSQTKREGFSKALKEQRSKLYIILRCVIMLVRWHDWRRTVLALDFLLCSSSSRVGFFFLSRLPANRMVGKLCIWITLLKYESIFSFVPLIVCLLVYQLFSLHKNEKVTQWRCFSVSGMMWLVSIGRTF